MLGISKHRIRAKQMLVYLYSNLVVHMGKDVDFRHDRQIK
jgi:hypothetical protein